MINAHPSSFKDPNGSVVLINDEVFRIIRSNYEVEYNHLMSSGLHRELLDTKLIINHSEVVDPNLSTDLHGDYYKIIKPELLTISYPSEWSFGQLKDAALTTLRIQQIALKYGMILKDCSAYNIQFSKGNAVLIDTLSFRFFEPGEPWLAYRQFCEHFYGPLLLIARVDPGLACLFNSFIDGIPIELVNKLLPLRNKFSLGVQIHIVLHSKSKVKHKNSLSPKSNKRFTKEYISQITENLFDEVEKLKWEDETNWSLYYQQDVDPGYLELKKKIVADFLVNNNSKRVLDFGANDGTISRFIGAMGIEVISADFDHASVQRNYSIVKEEGIKSVLPLVINAINPTPAFGWANSERQSFTERLNVDTLLSLALIHHLVIFYNIPFEKIGSYFAGIANQLVIEFIPKSDPMVKRLLQAKEDIYPFYTIENFEEVFCKYFKLRDSVNIPNSDRVLFFFKK